MVRFIKELSVMLKRPRQAFVSVEAMYETVSKYAVPPNSNFHPYIILFNPK